jgi:hypothetical protein
MNSSTVSYAIQAEAIRVFCGFRNPNLSEAQFFTQLGQTFMPGTPYMLQPLGLAAYLPGVLSNPAANLPQEFALICYASPEVWDKAMHSTLRGRVYNQTHGGVYAMPPSGASFPAFVENLPGTAVDPYYLFQQATDWQVGGSKVAVAGKLKVGQSGVDFRTELRSALLNQRSKLEGAGIGQVVTVARDDFAVIWFHSLSGDLQLDTDFLSGVLSVPTVLENQRVVCVDEPPILNITKSSAYNFIFLRESKYFLR